MVISVSSVASPCIKKCTLNASDVCVGCYRSLQEIGAWSSASDAEKREILRLCEERRQAQINRLAPSSWRAPAE